MARTTEVFEIDEIVVVRNDIGGGNLYRRDKYIYLTDEEWEKLFSLEFDFYKQEKKILLVENGLQPKFVKTEIYNGTPYLDIRHWYYCNGEYFPTRMGIKLKQNEWNDIKKWVNSRG